MPMLATDWATISSLATAGGTLVLAVATFAAVRSANRSARLSEVALQEQRRPLLAHSRIDDPLQKIMFLEGNWVAVAGGRAAVQDIDGRVYFVISLRNVGSGIAVCQGWVARSGESVRTLLSHAPLEDFRPQSRDLYVPGGDVGIWQGALRDPDDPVRQGVIDAIESHQNLTIELLYSDLVGRQRTISRFGLTPTGDTWLASLNRHWYLDWDGPRPESATQAAAELILREQAAADERRSEESSTIADGPPSAAAPIREDAEGTVP